MRTSIAYRATVVVTAFTGLCWASCAAAQTTSQPVLSLAANTTVAGDSAARKPGISPIVQGLRLQVSLVEDSRHDDVPGTARTCGPVWLKIKITNLDHAPLETTSPLLYWRELYPKDWPYTVKILDAQGKPVPETAYAREVERQRHHSGTRGIISDGANLLSAKGKAMLAEFPAGMYYDLTLQGKYTVLVTYTVATYDARPEDKVTLTAAPLTIDLLQAELY